MDKEHLLKTILNKYLRGTATPEEVRQVELWYDSFPEDESLLQDAVQKEAFRKALVSRIISKTIRRRYKWPSVAAAAVLLIAAGLGLYQFAAKPPAALKAELVNVPFGAHRSIKLSDGSVVHLNAGSQLTIGADYGKKERRITLSGEAFFDIVKDPEHPFLIQSGGITTAVLGTSFNIKAYPEQKDWQINVASGAVKVMREQEVLAAMLTANKALRYDTATRSLAITTVHTSEAWQWRNNILHFSNSSLEEIARELERQYNIPITVQGKQEGHYKISFDKQPLPDVLNILADLTGITYTTEHGKIIIHAQKSNQHMME